ncbi:MAG: DUF3108 domain-containing protein [Rhodomicrobium sp.]
MLKLPLLGGKLERTAAALLFSVLLPLGVATEQAFAGEGSEQAAPASISAPPEKKAEETAKQPAAEPAKPAMDAAKPDGEAVKPAGEAAKQVSADQKPADAKPAESKAGDDAALAGSKDTNAIAKPSDSKPEGASAKSAEGETGSKPSVKTGEASAEPLPPAAPKDVKTGAKPANAPPAEAGAKPRDLSPKTDGAQSLAVRASSVNAVYNIHFLGAHIGDFRIHSSITNRQYQLQANADISVFFGAVNWKGVTASHGLMTANGPVPQNYTFHYATSDKREAVEIRFQQRMVQDIIINPPSHPGARSVPITAADLQNVLDPLSAVILLSQARLSQFGGADACNKRLPIFDGRVRYDLVLSPKGTRSIGNSGKLHGTAYVCRVNYVPIAGHKQGKSGDYATGNTGIEIWLVPMPEAGLLVPYYVHVPTPAGTASMVTAKFDVETPGGRHAFAD